MKKEQVAKELNSLRIVLNDLTGESEIGEHYINVLSKAIFIIGNKNWEFNTTCFDIKCEDLANSVKIDIYHKDAKIDSHVYDNESIISDKDEAKA